MRPKAYEDIHSCVDSVVNLLQASVLSSGVPAGVAGDAISERLPELFKWADQAMYDPKRHTKHPGHLHTV